MAAAATNAESSAIAFTQLRLYAHQTTASSSRSAARATPDYYAQMADRAAAIFPDFTLDVFAEAPPLDPPHRIEPDRTAAALRALWQRASASGIWHQNGRVESTQAGSS